MTLRCHRMFIVISMYKYARVVLTVFKTGEDDRVWMGVDADEDFSRNFLLMLT